MVDGTGNDEGAGPQPTSTPDPAGQASAAVAPAPNPVHQAWTVVASSGSLILGQSQQEYAVYDLRNTYGRWPLTPEGYDYAVRTYEAYRQSPAHGLAYTATGYQDPARLGVPTQAVIKSTTYASPMSYVGSTRRIVRWAKDGSQRNPGRTVLFWVSGAFALVFMWVFLVFWYSVVFGLFGIFMFPYRLIRRSQRKNLHIQQTSLATQQAMLQQLSIQQQALMRQPAAYPQPAAGDTPLGTPGPYLPPTGSPAISPPPPSPPG